MSLIGYMNDDQQERMNELEVKDRMSEAMDKRVKAQMEVQS